MSNNECWLIYSREHRMWWRSNSRGYTKDIAEAGRYAKREAERICEQAGTLQGDFGPAEFMMRDSRGAELPETVQGIVELFLRENGYDGLVDDGPCGCGCDVDDLIPCDDHCDHCRPGYRGPDPSGDCDSMIYSSHEAVAEAEKVKAEKDA